MTDEINFEFLGREMRQSIAVEDLPRIEDACVVFEGRRQDSDKVPYWIYTVGGRLDGEIIGGKEGGALVGGDTIIVHAKSRPEADEMAYDGLMTTIKAQLGQKDKLASAVAASFDMVSRRKH